jgi:hypothetical protein
MRFLMIALLLVCASPALAQRQGPPATANDGLWFGANVGQGFARVDCDICRGGRKPAFTGSLRMGARVHPRVLVGAEVTGWMRGDNQVDERIWAVSGIAQYYLRRRPNLFLKAGLAAMSYRIEDTQDVLSAGSLGIQAGAGYDLPIGSRLFLTPSLTISRGIVGGTLKFNGAEIPDRASVTLVQLGVGVTRR